MATYLTDRELQTIANLWLDRVTELGRLNPAASASEWQDILPPTLYRKAVDAGYFGAPGASEAGQADSLFTGVQSATIEGGVRPLRFDLYVDGKVVASEEGEGDFDTVDFAKRHGVSI